MHYCTEGTCQRKNRKDRNKLVNLCSRLHNSVVNQGSQNSSLVSHGSRDSQISRDNNQGKWQVNKGSKQDNQNKRQDSPYNSLVSNLVIRNSSSRNSLTNKGHLISTNRSQGSKTKNQVNLKVRVESRKRSLLKLDSQATLKRSLSSLTQVSRRNRDSLVRSHNPDNQGSSRNRNPDNQDSSHNPDNQGSSRNRNPDNQGSSHNPDNQGSKTKNQVNPKVRVESRKRSLLKLDSQATLKRSLSSLTQVSRRNRDSLVRSHNPDNQGSSRNRNPDNQGSNHNLARHHNRGKLDSNHNQGSSHNLGRHHNQGSSHNLGRLDSNHNQGSSHNLGRRSSHNLGRHHNQGSSHNLGRLDSNHNQGSSRNRDNQGSNHNQDSSRDQGNLGRHHSSLNKKKKTKAARMRTMTMNTKAT
jgi:hypothetical protein